MRRLLASFWLAVAPVCAQCVMCYRTAAAQEAARARLLDFGILLLGVPPFAILAGFCYLAWKRNAVTAAASENAESQLPPATPHSR